MDKVLKSLRSLSSTKKNKLKRREKLRVTIEKFRLVAIILPIALPGCD
jgi:hypothetical protein